VEAEGAVEAGAAVVEAVVDDDKWRIIIEKRLLQ
jgi:hypothetical protein